MSYKSARQESITALTATLNLASDTYPEAASRLFTAITDDSMTVSEIYEFAEASPKALRELSLVTADMSDDCIKFMLSFTLARALLLSVNTSAVLLDLRTAAVIAPLVIKVPLESTHTIELLRNHTKQMNAVSAIVVSREMKAKMGTLKTGLQLMIGTRLKLNSSEKDLVRGHYMHKCSGDLISLDDREWFGANVDALLPVWSRLTDSSNFSRGYAEQVLSGAMEHGTALIDGIL
jgi:hypothetical protein